MTDVESPASPTVPQWWNAFDRVLFALGAATCLGLLAYKLFLVGRLNINWDEFLYLNQVYAMARGEMTVLFQAAYSHLFQWVTYVAADEVGQVVKARVVMVTLLGITAVLIWLLGRRWLAGFPSIVPPLAYLSALPIVMHGGSFRSDSLLAPLVIAALLLVTRWRNPRWRDWCAGILLGAAIAVTIKSTILLPIFVVILGARESAVSGEYRRSLDDAAVGIGQFLLGCAASAAILLTLHGSFIAALPADSIVTFGGRVAGKTLFEVPLFPQFHFLHSYFDRQPLPWLLIALGTVAAVFQRRFEVAALSLSLLPIVFYRNAFPYFYVVMLAPAVVLAGVAVQEFGSFLRPRSTAIKIATLQGIIAAGLFYQTLAPVRRAWDDDQGQQRAVVSAVHEIFPEPVAYIDRCGMISSFRKANFFMSTWGLEDYHARGTPFMARTLREHKPAFVLVNTRYLDPDTGGQLALLPQDRELIRNFYPVYWGPVRVAGAEASIDGRDAVQLTVPFAATYRIVTQAPVRIDGVVHRNGDVITMQAGNLTVTVAASDAAVSRGKVTLFLAAAQPAPDFEPPDTPIFTPL
jgi:hypothetical protein